MKKDSIFWGEPYDLEADAKDENGEPIDFDETWSAVIRVTRNTRGGEIVLDAPLDLVEGKLTLSIDTRDPIWSPGIYVYDIRFTNADGVDQWNEPVQLTLKNRNAPASS